MCKAAVAVVQFRLEAEPDQMKLRDATGTGVGSHLHYSAVIPLVAALVGFEIQVRMISPTSASH